MTDKGKLDWIYGFLRGTAGSVFIYSAEALRDRMEYVAAFIDDDQKAMKKWADGDLCQKEQEEQRERLPN